ncbi:MAG: hypothetical protein RIE86_27815 [Imperialibacter sp.]|uniref:hypothetical protein n=1 Tax=Imperialibacter sp. TaxID=2038411 RepID=UPI0032ED6596
MKNISIFFIVSIYVLISGCSNDSGKESTEAPKSLVGTWELVSYMSDSSGGKAWIDHPSNILYQKHLTPTHFTWISYQKDNDQLVGMGGGTYTYDGENYVENIEFFLPATSSILGQKINFTADFVDGEWHHRGFVKDFEFDVESAETVVVDSSRIEEMWRKVPAVAKNDTSLVGTWELVSYHEKEGGPEMSYPGFVKYMKLVTPSHFVWIQYNDDGDYISGTGTGSIIYDGKTYTENVAMIHPSGHTLTGATITFGGVVNANRWTLFAEKTVKQGQEIDSVYIDETWARYKKP